MLPNLISNALAFAIRIGIALWFIPYLVSQVGTAAYGLIPLAVSITSYLGIATTSIGSAVSRELILFLTRGDGDAANKVFNTALFGLVVLSLILLGPLLLISLNAGQWLNIPKGFDASATKLFLWIGGAFLITTVASPFAASSFAKHRLDLANGITILENVVRVSLVIILFLWVGTDVTHVGMATFMAAVVAAILQILLWKKLTPGLGLHPGKFDRSMLRGLFSTGGWVVIGHVGTLLLLSVDLVLANKLFGSTAGGNYALALQWGLLLRSLSATIAGTFLPTITSLYAEGDFDRVQRMLRRSIRAVGLVMALPIGLTCGFALPLMETWLGPGYVDLTPLVILITAPLILNVPTTPVYSVVMAANRVRTYGIVTLLLGLANPILAWILAVTFDWGIYGIAASTSLLLVLRSFTFDLQFSSRILGVRATGALKDLGLAALMTLLIGVAGYFIAGSFSPNTWLKLAMCALPIALIYGVFAWLVILSPAERHQLLNRIQ